MTILIAVAIAFFILKTFPHPIVKLLVYGFLIVLFLIMVVLPILIIAGVLVLAGG